MRVVAAVVGGEVQSLHPNLQPSRMDSHYDAKDECCFLDEEVTQG